MFGDIVNFVLRKERKFIQDIKILKKLKYPFSPRDSKMNLSGEKELLFKKIYYTQNTSLIQIAKPYYFFSAYTEG